MSERNSVIKSLQLEGLQEDRNFSKCYIISHAIFFSLLSLCIIFFEFVMLFNADYWLNYIVESSAQTITIGIYFIFMAFLSLLFCKFFFYYGSIFSNFYFYFKFIKKLLKVHNFYSLH